MREVQASEAKAHLPQLLDAVERGETIVITRHGRAIAGIEGLRRRTGKIDVEELLSARHAGHRD